MYIGIFFIVYVHLSFLMETECDNGTFGQDCKQACGKCLRGEQCDHVNGTCLNGCDAGYQGLECTEGNVL